MAKIQIKGSPTQALIMATVGFFGGFAGVSLFGPMVPKFTALMGLSPVQAGVLAAITNLSGSLLRIPFGAAVDRYGGKVPLLTLLGLSCIGLPGLIYVVSTYYPNNMTPSLYPWLLVLGILIGSGIATFSVGIAQVSYWFPRREIGKANAIYGGLGNLAPGLFSWLLPVAVEALGITGAYLAWMTMLLLVILVYAVFMHDAPSFQLRRQGVQVRSVEELRPYGQELLPAASPWQSLKASAALPTTWALVALYFTSFGGFLALTAWFPTFWNGFYQTAPKLGGLLTLLYAVTTSLARVPGGSLSDKFGAFRVLNWSLLSMVLGAIIITFGRDLAISLTGAIFMAFGMGVQNAAVFKLVPMFGARAVGGTSGWVGGLGAFGGFVLPVLMGMVAGTSLGFTGTFLVFLPLAAVNFGLVYWLQSYERRSLA